MKSISGVYLFMEGRTSQKDKCCTKHTWKFMFIFGKLLNTLTRSTHVKKELQKEFQNERKPETRWKLIQAHAKRKQVGDSASFGVYCEQTFRKLEKLGPPGFATQEIVTWLWSMTPCINSEQRGCRILFRSLFLMNKKLLGCLFLFF